MTVIEPRGAASEGAVLDVALTLFAERGYHGTALSQIADVLGIRTPSLYNHMRSKQDLLRAIVDETTATVLSDFRRATADGDWVTRLYAATRVYAYRHATHRREALVVNRDTGSLDEPYRGRFQDRRRQHEHAFRTVIASGAQAGVFRVETPSLASFAIREMCVSIARWFRDDGTMPAADVAEQYGRYALRIAGAPDT